MRFHHTFHAFQFNCLLSLESEVSYRHVFRMLRIFRISLNVNCFIKAIFVEILSSNIATETNIEFKKMIILEMAPILITWFAYDFHDFEFNCLVIKCNSKSGNLFLMQFKITWHEPPFSEATFTVIKLIF